MFNSGNDDIDLIDLFFLIALLYAGYMIICRKTEFLNDIFLQRAGKLVSKSNESHHRNFER